MAANTLKPLISFHSVKELCSRAEMLPQGPQWMCKPWEVSHPTKRPMNLFYRDSIECLHALFGSPLFSDSMLYSPFRKFKTAAKLVRVYDEWMSGNVSWNMQVSILGRFVCLYDPDKLDRNDFLQVLHYSVQFCLPIRRIYLL